MARLLLIGAGGHGKAVADAVIRSGEHRLVGFLDDTLPEGSTIGSAVVLGTLSMIAKVKSSFDKVFVSIGANVVRENIMRRLQIDGYEFATIVHPSSIISSGVVLGSGSVVMAGAVIGVEAYLGNGVIVNVGAIVDHNASVDDFAHVGINAAMSGGSNLGRGSLMLPGSRLLCGVRSGTRVTIIDRL